MNFKCSNKTIEHRSTVGPRVAKNSRGCFKGTFWSNSFHFNVRIWSKLIVHLDVLEFMMLMFPFRNKGIQIKICFTCFIKYIIFTNCNNLGGIYKFMWPVGLRIVSLARRWKSFHRSYTYLNLLLTMRSKRHMIAVSSTLFLLWMRSKCAGMAA